MKSLSKDNSSVLYQLYFIISTGILRMKGILSELSRFMKEKHIDLLRLSLSFLP